jgi:arsenite methyltransferase
MSDQSASLLYEDIAPSWPSGVPLRPGGLALTENALSFCAFPPGVRLLDIGCGSAVTLEYLRDRHKFKTCGVDPSSILLTSAIRRKAGLPLVRAEGEALPFRTGIWDGVLAECSLSVARNPDLVLLECNRVLKDEGKLILSDIFLRSEGGPLRADDGLPSLCPAGALPKEEILQKLKCRGFKTILWEDHSSALKLFLAQLILSDYFTEFHYSRSTNDSSGPSNADNLNRVFPGPAVGYFLLIAGKAAHHQRLGQVSNLTGGVASDE